MLLFATALLIQTIFSGVPLLMARKLGKYIRERCGPNGAFWCGVEAVQPRVSMIVPCRGLEPGLEQNLEASLTQDYASFEALLVTTEDDESLPLLQRLAGRYPGHARVVLAPRAERCAQKLQNQLAALAAADSSAAIYVFVDSDGRVNRDFLREMIGPLSEPGVGLVTGWRWYLPEPASFWGYIRSAWNAGAIPFLVNSRHNIAFGGAMAVYREVFDRSGAAAKWGNAVSDGLALARAVKDLGLTVRFAPRCIAVSRQGGTFREVPEWTNRQATISRVYMPEFWRFTALAHAASLLVVAIAMAVGLWVVGIWGAVAAFLCYIALLEANAWLLIRTMTGILEPEAAENLRAGRSRFLLAAPIASWLYGINIIRSAFSRTVVWRGIRYEMRSPNETRVIWLEQPKLAPVERGADPTPVKKLSRMDERVHRYRAQWTFERLQHLVEPGDRVLDLGAGDCRLDLLLEERAQCAVVPVDVVDMNETSLPLTLYDGARLPFAEDSYDVVLLIFVLHHAEDPHALLEEASRVCRRRVVVFEDVNETWWTGWFFARFIGSCDGRRASRDRTMSGGPSNGNA